MIPRKRRSFVLLLAGLVLVGAVGAAGAAPAAAPGLLHYQGRFTDSEGNPLAGPVDLRFTLYALPVGGGAVWSEEHTGVLLADGVGEVLLGSLVALPEQAFSAPQRYLEIAVNGNVLSPRLTVASTPFALEADRLDGQDASAFEEAGAAAALRDSLAASDGTPPDQGANRVHWDNLAGVPAGFADAVDDTGAGVSDHGQLSGLLDDDHPQYMLRTDLAQDDGSPPNEGANLVDWNNLTGVPPGFADGIDAGGSGGSGGPFTGADIVDSTLTGADVAPRSLTGGHLALDSVTGAELAPGAVGGSRSPTARWPPPTWPRERWARPRCRTGA